VPGYQGKDGHKYIEKEKSEGCIVGLELGGVARRIETIA